VEKYGTAVQTPVDNIILRMRHAYSVTSATDTHSPYAMDIAVGYTRVHQWNIKHTLSLWLKIQITLSYTIRPTIHAVTLNFRFSQRYKQPTHSSVILKYVFE
jgi:hypothetical protein